MDFNMFKYVAFIFYFFIIRYSHGQLCRNNQYNSKQQTKTSSCMIWGNYHLKTFDDHGVSFHSSCKFTMTSFMIGTTTFRVEVGKSAYPCEKEDCYTSVSIFYGTEVHKLTVANGQPVYMKDGQTVKIPFESQGFSLYKKGNRVFVDFTDIGISIRWNVESNVEVMIDNSKSYRLFGLCGNNDKCSSNDQILSNGEPSNNLEKFLQGWQTDKGSCQDTIKTESPCSSASSSAEHACQILKNERKFGVANTIVNPDPFIRACTWDYCSCKSTSPTPCLCATLDAYAKTSISEGVTRVSWRDAETCPKKCTGDLVFQPCAPKGGPRTCGDGGPSETVEKCEEGCYCIVNNFFFDGKCYTKRKCPCVSQGKVLQPGETTRKDDCNTCTCTNGELDCTDKPCVCGTCCLDPHYTTFDGKKFDFMGRCAYYLVKGSDFSIESDQYGYFNGQFLKNYTEGPSYARAVIIRMAGRVVELKPDFVTEVNKVVVPRYPHKAGPLIITKPSDKQVLVYLPNNIQVEWDGYWWINVRVPWSMEGRTRGLLGTFNEDQSDDFLTPDGEIVDDPIVFGNSWKTEYSCRSEPVTPQKHPCDINPGSRAAAEKGCSIIKSEIFKKCNATDPETDYQNCVYDACYFKENVSKSYCDSITVFADECGRKRISVNWRESVPECKITCPAGLEYQTCSTGCTRSCEDIAVRPFCADVCIEGCNCPPGKTLNEEGHCIPIGQCMCRISGVAYPAGFKYLKNEEELLTCTNARWVVTEPDVEELKKVPYLDQLYKRCHNHSLYSPCRAPNPKTCQNMNDYKVESIDKCQEGCQCTEEYVYDNNESRCVKPEDCPCHSKEGTFPAGSIVKLDSCNTCICRNGAFLCVKEQCEQCPLENEIRKKDCNTCTCKNGGWHCTKKDCSPPACHIENEVKIQDHGKCVCREGSWRCVRAQCDVWGDSHIKTFDGVHYEFQGECSYALTQGKVNDHQFNFIFTNERCSHAGATCLKQITINTHVKGVPESLTLVKNEKLPDTHNKKSLLLTDYVSFVTIDFIGAGVRIFWDKKTWANVQLDSQWSNRVVGLCGNFNGSKNDDLNIKGQALARKDAYRYVNLWRTSAKCPNGPKPDACSDARTKWAKEKCNVLHSDLFSQCRSRVPVADYYKACISDTCNCETADDCQRLCTVISVYAQQCNNYGDPVNWRSEKLCPLHCTGYTEYHSCMKLCPQKTCETVEKKIPVNCEEEACVEGCAPKCLPPGLVYTDSTYKKSVRESACTSPRCHAGGNTYYDQDVIAKTPCKLSYCSHGKEVCLRLPTCPNGKNSTSGCSCTCPNC